MRYVLINVTADQFGEVSSFQHVRKNMVLSLVFHYELIVLILCALSFKGSSLHFGPGALRFTEDKIDSG